MLRIVDCLTVDHDMLMVLLAAGVCAVGVAATVMVAEWVVGPRQTRLWFALLGLCAGATVWATHFLAMLAYKTSLAITYGPTLTALSFVVGALIMGIGFAVAALGREHVEMRLLGGGILGAGVALLHYIGMAALRFPGRLEYAPDLVIASVVVSVGFGAAALLTLFGPPRTATGIASGLLLIAMTVSLHFTAMGGVQLSLTFADVDAVAGISRAVLAGGVTAAALVVLTVAVIGAAVDRRFSSRLDAEAERYRTLADGAFEGLLVHREGAIVDANPAARRMLGLDDDLSRHLGDAGLWPLADPGSGAAADCIEQSTYEIELRRPDGACFPAEVSTRRMLLPDGTPGQLLAIRDLTARKQSEARIAHLALHDPLTDLPNRRFFVELANKSIAQAKRSGDRFAMLAIDLDGFKIVNDMHGHAAGDELLRQAAARIHRTLRDADVVARLGGDEFAVLQTGAVTLTQAMTLAERLLEILAQPIRLDEVEVCISASIGLALYPADGETVEDLLRNADTAMYRAKSDGKATYRFFEPRMDATLETRRRLEVRLRRALAEERLDVAYQPIVDSHSRQTLGFEALVRWTDEELGPIPPVDFIPVAEETGLIVAMGEFVLNRACREAAAWPDPIRVAVNLSAVQFKRPGLVASVRRALADNGLAGERLELEITESLLIENPDDALTILKQLKGLGVHIAMDDFGTGYSSLGYLKSFPFDKIKIDRMFVADLQDGTDNANIVKAVAAMGKSMHMRVVAEGVETDGQAGMLEELACDELQGYLIARPMRADEVGPFLLAATHPQEQFDEDQAANA